MYNNLSAFQKKKKKIREKIKKQKNPRLTVYKSNKHIYVQLFEYNGSKVILSFSSLNKEFKSILFKKKMTKKEQSFLVGNFISQKIKDKGINKVVFDRSGFKFHGRIKAVADSIIKNGIIC